MKKIWHDFQEFISRGNVIDLAIGIIIGAAFSAVVNSLVNNIMMPPMGILLSDADFQDLFLVLKQGETPLQAEATLQMAQDAGAITLNYGLFLADVISFLIIAFCVFMIVKGIKSLEDRLSKAKEKEEAPEDKDCPYCHKPIPIEASRCPYCTSQLEKNPSDD